MGKAGITKLFVHNFMSLRQYTMPISPFTTYITGLNGSGKSTIQDCMSLILYGEDQDMLNYVSDNRRDVKTAMHWQTPEGSRRPGPVYSYVIIEGVDAAGFVYHQGVRLYSTNVGKSADMLWFTGEGPIDDIGIDNIDLLDTGSLRMERSMTNKNAALKQFFERRGYPVNTFVNARFDDNRHDSVYRYRAVCRSLLDNRNIGSASTLSEYVRTQIFPATSTGSYIDGINKSFDDLKRIKNELEIKRARCRGLSNVCSVCDSWISAMNVMADADLLLSYVFLKRSLKILEQNKEAVAQRNIEIERLHDLIERIDAKINKLLEEKADIKRSSDIINRAQMNYDSARLAFDSIGEKKARHDVYVMAYNALVEFFDESGYPNILDGESDLKLRCDDVDTNVKIIEAKGDSLTADIQYLSDAINAARTGYDAAKSAFAMVNKKKEQHDAFMAAYDALVEFFDENGYPDVPEEGPNGGSEYAFEGISEFELSCEDIDMDVKITDLKLSSLMADIQKYDAEVEKYEQRIMALNNEKLALLGRGFNDDGSGFVGSYVSQMINAGRRLCAAIEKAVPGSEPKLLCDCVEDVDAKKWQLAIERLIKDNRFGVVVAPEFYDRACRVQHGLFSENTIIVLDTSVQGSVEKNAVVKHLVFNNEHAKNFVLNNYGRYVQCSTDDAYAAAKFGVREDGQIKQGNRSIKYGSKNAITLVFGYEAVRLEQERLDKEIKRCSNTKTSIMRMVSSMRRQYDTFNELRNSFIALKNNYNADIDDLYAEAELAFEQAEAELVDANTTQTAVLADKKREYNVFNTLRDDFIASKNGYIAGMDELYEQAKLAFEQAEAELEAANSSYDAAIIEEKIAEIDGKLDRLRLDEDAVRKNLYNNERENAEANDLIARSEKSIDEYRSVVPDGFVPSEEQQNIIDMKGWENIGLGVRSKEEQIKQLSDSVALAHDEVIKKLNDIPYMAGDLRIAYVDMPITIETLADARWFYDKRDQLKDDIDAASVAGSVDNLTEALKNSYVNVLNMMAGEYREADVVRRKFNSILTKYKIGMCRYRIGPISVSHSVANVRGVGRNLLDIAVSLGNGNDLTVEDINILNAAMEAMRSSKNMNGMNLFNYVDYMSVAMQFKTDEQSDWQNANRQARFNSNGQQTILRYILKLAVVDALAFTDNSMRFVMVDEVLQGVDEVNARYFFQALADMNVQAMLSSMNPLYSYDSNYTYICSSNPKDHYITDMHRTEIAQSVLDGRHGTHRASVVIAEANADTKDSAEAENEFVDETEVVAE